MSSRALGFVLAAASAFFNGSFAALSKLQSVRESNVSPPVFNFFLTLGVAASCLMATPFVPDSGHVIGICWQGILAGTLLVLATYFSFVAIPHVGVSVGQGVWGGTAILVSFLWGVVPPHSGVWASISKPVKSWGATLAAVALLVIGVLGIIYSMSVSDGSGASDEAAARRRSAKETDALRDAEGGYFEQHDDDQGGDAAARGEKSMVIGLASALAVGFSGGSILVPSTFAPQEYAAVGFLPSFGLGALLAGIVVTFVLPLVFGLCSSSSSFGAAASAARNSDNYVFLGQELPLPALLPGMAAGVLWNLGNICSIYAMDARYGALPYGVAYPLLQCALVVSGLWGVFLFREITGGAAIAAFFVAAAVVICGAVLLGLYGPQ